MHVCVCVCMFMCGHADILHWGRTGYCMLPVFVFVVVVVNASAGNVHRLMFIIIMFAGLAGTLYYLADMLDPLNARFPAFEFWCLASLLY